MHAKDALGHLDAAAARNARCRYRAGAVGPTSGCGKAGLRRSGAHRGGRGPRLLGLRGHAVGGGYGPRVPFAITHAPGHMFITDVPDSAYYV